VIVPFLNGMRHLDVLEAKFGKARVLGGVCVISSTLNADGSITQMGGLHAVTFGPRDGVKTETIEALAKAFSGAGFDFQLSDNILQDMWEKWVFLATAAAITSLMRSSIGDILAGGGGDVVTALHEECTAVARKAGHEPRPAARERARTMFGQAGSPLTASMFRDIQAGASVEADHVVGDLLARAGSPAEAPVLRIAYAHLKTYEARLAREAATA
jgi:2-dehydropantoate 2-reductase